MLDSLMQQGAIEKKENHSRDEFYITDKGRTILAYFDRSKAMLRGTRMRGDLIELSPSRIQVPISQTT